MNPTSFDFDVLIVGSGLAGLSAAVHLAPTHRVAVLTKRVMSDGSSGWAQGGIAAVMDRTLLGVPRMGRPTACPGNAVSCSIS